jgi:hypothetical protein
MIDWEKVKEYERPTAKNESERRNYISQTLSEYYKTNEGTKNKQQAHIKRSKTMRQIRENIRATITNKKCTKCKMVKDANKFGKKTDARDGLQPYCRDCINEIKRANRR